ncbi:MAG: hypothetical protein JWO37_732 [Acidimicrobiales bacterium]|nr:hypothetical protein [Acidimicrobiales bacterium]
MLDRAHEWLSFEDPDEERTWIFDVTFLLSSWECIFGRGCQGVLTGPAPELVQGCCSYGAHFVDDDDLARIEKKAAQLTAAEWQFRSKGRRKDGVLKISKVNKDADTVTRMADDACIFLNRPGFGAGPGCALHQAALSRGERPVDWKPEVCWQLPLRRDEEEDGAGHVTTTIRQWDRPDWGAGGAEFHWWCTESPSAFIGAEPVYRSMREELIEMTGTKVYKRLAGYLESRTSGAVPLPHPVVRTRK